MIKATERGQFSCFSQRAQSDSQVALLKTSTPFHQNIRPEHSTNMTTIAYNAIRKVEKIIGYTFTNSNLCWEALQGKGVNGFSDGNKRLAMYGDSILRMLILKTWYPNDDSRSKEAKTIPKIYHIMILMKRQSRPSKPSRET